MTFIDHETQNFLDNLNQSNEPDVSELNEAISEAIDEDQSTNVLLDDHNESDCSISNNITMNNANDTFAEKNNTKKRRLSEDIEPDENDLSMSGDQPKKKQRQSVDDAQSDFEIITLDSDDENIPQQVNLKKTNFEMKKYDSEPEIIELSDTEVDYKPKIQPILSKPITGVLSMNKSSTGQHVLAKVEKIEKQEKIEEIEYDDDIIIEYDVPSTSKQAYLLESNPSMLNKADLKAQVAQGLTARQTNRNASFEDQIRSLINPIFKSMESKPEPDRDFDNFASPKGLKVKLLPHQCYSMEWLNWRESEYPNGGILADDMGLGKTLTILSYLKTVKDSYEKKHREKLGLDENCKEEFSDKENDFSEFDFLRRLKSKKNNKNLFDSDAKRLKTLIVLPASLLHQWQGEIESKFEKNSFKVHVYHEADRKKYSYNLENNDIVFTTYEIISREVTVPDKEGYIPKSDSPLANIKWKRIILDEAHRIKNHSTKVNKAMCTLKAKYRLVITGTPVHNSLNDLYSLIKFLHFEPLDDFGLWKYLFAAESFAAKSRNNSDEREKRVGFWLKFLSDYLLLRRTKKDKFHGTDKCIVDLPDKRIEEVRFKLNNGEDIIYKKIFDESKEKVNEFLNEHQNRQACCHMSLLAECLDKSELENHKFEIDSEKTSFNSSNDFDEISNEFSMLNSSGSEDSRSSASDDGLESLKQIKSHPNLLNCLKKSYMSSKIEKSISMISDLLEEYPDDKLIIVSQWTSVLSIIGKNLKKRDITFCEIKGDVALAKRNEIVEEFNDKSNGELKVMLLSLTAGGVGLNLIGANRMFLLDIHWNPALEQQCADRIYRVGQKKNVTIYKFLCEETIEERIQQIQQGKIQIAERVCRSGAEASIPGAPTNVKLTIGDFKLLFKDFDTK